MAEQAEILCVDDEPRVVEGLRDLLDDRYTVHTAESGAEGLAVLERRPQIAVVLSDMRMPEMDGAAFLERVRTAAPNATRMLLTGYSDMESAIAAVNRGQIFRFLTKPCDEEDLRRALDAAVRQHRLVTAEKVLLQNTLLGSLKALMQVLAVINPLAFGRALRLKKLVRGIAAELPESASWHWEVAALMCQVGCMNLPEALLMKLNVGDALDTNEQRDYDQALRGAATLLTSIPRMEPVIETLRQLRARRRHRSGKDLSTSAQVLAIALDYDALEARGWLAADVLTAMRLQAQYETSLVDALERSLDIDRGAEQIEAVPLAELTEGMVVAEDLCRASGVLVLPRGITLEPNVLEHLRKYAAEIPTVKVRRSAYRRSAA